MDTLPNAVGDHCDKVNTVEIKPNKQIETPSLVPNAPSLDEPHPVMEKTPAASVKLLSSHQSNYLCRLLQKKLKIKFHSQTALSIPGVIPGVPMDHRGSVVSQLSISTTSLLSPSMTSGSIMGSRADSRYEKQDWTNSQYSII